MRHKGVEDVIAAAAELERRKVGVQLIVCGAAIQRDYARELERMAAGSQFVSFIGAVSQTEVLSLMRHARATVVCSRVENSSRVPVEAMSVESPLICVDVSSTRSSAGEASLYYPAGDHHRLADLMEAIHNDEAARERLIAKGRGRISHLDWLSASRTILATLGLS
jgi:glycosyltransferase involved in cell wall biosynthesis